MSFEDLPENWTEMPLTSQPLAADAVDLLISEKDRARSTMLLLPCDARGVAYPTPVLIGEIDWHVGPSERREMLEALASLQLESALVAASSRHRLSDAVVAAWATDLQEIFDDAGTWLLGFFSVWPLTVEPVALRLRA
ncbi:hypothetical protein [Nesterenkonia sp. PF2B19]|uniref:hypothetical protein n=1 Tax=Nesterenkonia sp. PF2B19 TaxID=1881858 RepID=UPI00087315FC|nr:hypothetical protein [Nesterenkonia sp. PF2B19]OSM42293.1 hypothetical protein BCY76_015225 [Nesterenkonia sp. PF2B19]